MTRKDYEKIAKVFKDFNTSGRIDLTIAMADMLAGDNPRFDRERFLKACGW